MAPQSPPQHQGTPQAPSGPPYPPQNHSYGGVPSVLPDVPVSAVFLLFYIVFAGVHAVIFKTNHRRGIKFLFSAAMAVFCLFRIVTFVLRLAWAFDNKNVGLGIAAQIFAHVGCVIPFVVNWFFAQRIARGQHTDWGWAMWYRIVFRASLVGMVIALLLLIVAAIQQVYTLDTETLRVDRYIQVAGQTYFAALCFGPIVVIYFSVNLPMRGTEDFGAGRLRNNIWVLFIFSTILTIGAFFRAIVTWQPVHPLRSPSGTPLPAPWYDSKACFYPLNFLTELLVIMAYAFFRVDMRFYIPDGARNRGDYSKYDIYDLHEKDAQRNGAGRDPMMTGGNGSNETIHTFQSSPFEDTVTLADSLRYPSSILEVDQKTGQWKIKRLSTDESSSRSRESTRVASHMSMTSWNPDRDTFVATPPVPRMPDSARLSTRESKTPVESRSRSRSLYSGYGFNAAESDMSDAIAQAIASLEANSEENRASGSSSPAKGKEWFRYESTVASSSKTSIAEKPRRSRASSLEPPQYDDVVRTSKTLPAGDKGKSPLRYSEIASSSRDTIKPLEKPKEKESQEKKQQYLAPQAPPLQAKQSYDTSRSTTSFETAEEEQHKRFSFQESDNEGTGNESERDLERKE